MSFIPNSITILRILGALAIPLVILAYGAYLEGASARALIWLYAVALACTDRLDGWVARTLKAESEFGRLLDPVADFVYCLAIFAALVIAHWMEPITIAWCIFFAFYFWYGWSVYRLRKIGTIVSPSIEAKAGMFFLMLALLAALAAWAFSESLHIVAIALVMIAMASSWKALSPHLS